MARTKNWYYQVDTRITDDVGIRNMRLFDKKKAVENFGAYSLLMNVWARLGGIIHLENPGEYEMLKDAMRPWTDKRIKCFLDMLASDGVLLIMQDKYNEHSVVCSESSLKKYGDRAREMSERNAEAGRKSGEARRNKAKQNEQ